MEKELKELRISVIKSANTAGTFNNYSFTERELANPRNVPPSTGKNGHEKELTEIKEMIARTQKVMEDKPFRQQAETDMDRPFSRKNLF